MQEELYLTKAEDELKDLAIEIRALNSRKEYLFEQKGREIDIEEEYVNSHIAFGIIKERANSLDIDDKFNVIQGLVSRVDVFTIMKNGNKGGNKATIKYTIGHCIELLIPSNSETHTKIYNIESTWTFQAFSKKGGTRINWR